MMQVLLEERVIGLERRDVQAARGLDPDPMRDERRLDVQHVDAADEREASRERCARLHHAVLRIEREVARRLAQDARVVLPPCGIRGRDEPGLAAVRREVAAKRLDRCRHAVHAREVDVGDHQCTHAFNSPGDALRQRDGVVSAPSKSLRSRELIRVLQQ